MEGAMTIRHVVFALILGFISFSVLAESATGKWNATIEGPQGQFSMVFDFAVDGSNLTGSMSNDFMGTTPISDGKINGNDLSFKLNVNTPGGAMTINYKATVKGDEMTMTRTFENPPPGAPAERTFVAKRVKQ